MRSRLRTGSAAKRNALDFPTPFAAPVPLRRVRHNCLVSESAPEAARPLRLCKLWGLEVEPSLRPQNADHSSGSSATCSPKTNRSRAKWVQCEPAPSSRHTAQNDPLGEPHENHRKPKERKVDPNRNQAGDQSTREPNSTVPDTGAPNAASGCISATAPGRLR